MGQKKAKHYPPEFKLKVVLELLREEETLAQIGSKYKIAPKSLQNWKKLFLDNAELAFTKEKVLKEYKSKILDLRSEKDHLYKEIGKLTAKLSWAEKKIEDSFFIR